MLDTNYASMLRKFTLELEKENSVLFIFGFSLADKHIKDLLYSVMKSNPTLVVVYFSYSEYDEATDEKEEKKNTNLYIKAPEPGEHLSFDKSTEYLRSIFEKPEKSKEIPKDVEVSQDE